MDSKYENYKVKDRMSSDKVYSIHPQLLSVQFVQASSNNWKAKPINTIPAAVHLHSVGCRRYRWNQLCCVVGLYICCFYDANIRTSPKWWHLILVHQTIMCHAVTQLKVGFLQFFVIRHLQNIYTCRENTLLSWVLSKHKPESAFAPVNIWDDLDIVGVRHWIKNL